MAAKKRSVKKPVKRKAAKKAVKPSVKKTVKKPAPAAPERSGVLNIDYGLCQGCYGCAERFPRLFEMREERAWVVYSGVVDGELAEGVLLVCPYYAISLE